MKNNIRVVEFYLNKMWICIDYIVKGDLTFLLGAPTFVSASWFYLCNSGTGHDNSKNAKSQLHFRINVAINCTNIM